VSVQDIRVVLYSFCTKLDYSIKIYVKFRCFSKWNGSRRGADG